MPLRRTEWRGLPIVVENEAGSIRKWSGGETVMRFPYGYFADHGGSDGDELDCYIGTDSASRFVHVVHQLAPDGGHDEDKCFLDFHDEAAAKAAYLVHRNDGERAYGGMSVIPAEDFIAKLNRRTGDGKIRHSHMTRFTVPAFRFKLLPDSLAFDASDPAAVTERLKSAVGRWSRGMTMGYKARAKIEFNAPLLSSLVDVVRQRGDRVSICQDHKSAFVAATGQPAPSLGYFYALAVFDNGQLVEHWAYDNAGPPEAMDESGQPRNGLYCRLGEITPLGFDLKEGLANFSGLSPTFETNAEVESGEKVPIFLIDFAATSAGYQGGCALNFHLLSSPADDKVTTMARATDFSPGDRIQVRTSTGIWVPAAVTDIGLANVGYRTDSGATARISVEPSDLNPDIKKMSAAPSRVTTMARYRPGQDVQSLVDKEGFKRGEVVHILDVEDSGAPSTSRYNVTSRTKPLTAWLYEYEIGTQYMSATPGATGTGEGAKRMNPQILQKLGLAADASDADRKAAIKAFTAAAPTKMAIMDVTGCAGMAADLEAMAEFAPDEDKESMRAMAKKFKKLGATDVAPVTAPAAMAAEPDGDEPTLMDVDPSNLPQNAAVHLKTGNVHDEGGRQSRVSASTRVKTMSVVEQRAMGNLAGQLLARGIDVPRNATRAVLMSLAALAPAAQTDAAALKAEIKRELAAEAAAATEKTERDGLVTMARTAKAEPWEVEALSALPLATARQMATAKWGARTGAPAHLFSALSHQGAPLGGPTAGDARSMPNGESPMHARQTKDGDTIVEPDGALAAKARDLRDSKDPVIMSRVSAAAQQRFGAVDDYYRIRAAQELAASDFPHLVPRVAG